MLNYCFTSLLLTSCCFCHFQPAQLVPCAFLWVCPTTCRCCMYPVLYWSFKNQLWVAKPDLLSYLRICLAMQSLDVKMNHQRNPLSKPQTEFNPFFMPPWGLDPIVVCASSIRLLDRPEIQHLFAFKFSHKALKPRSLKCVCRLPLVKLTSKSYSPSDSTFSDPTLKTSLVSVYRATTAQCYSTDKRRERLWSRFFICFSTMYKWCWHTHFPKVGIYANQVRENVKIC